MINRLKIRKTPSNCLVSLIWIQLSAARNSSHSHLRWQKQLRSRVQGMVENHLLGIKHWALLNWNNHKVPSQLISSCLPSLQMCNRKILQSSLPQRLKITPFILPSTMAQRSSQTSPFKDILRPPSDPSTYQMLTPWETFHSSKVLVQSLSIRGEMTLTCPLWRPRTRQLPSRTTVTQVSLRMTPKCTTTTGSKEETINSAGPKPKALSSRRLNSPWKRSFRTKTMSNSASSGRWWRKSDLRGSFRRLTCSKTS